MLNIGYSIKPFLLFIKENFDGLRRSHSKRDLVHKATRLLQHIIFQAEVSAIQTAVQIIMDMHIRADKWIFTTIRLSGDFATVDMPLGTCGYIIDSAILNSVNDRWAALGVPLDCSTSKEDWSPYRALQYENLCITYRFGILGERLQQKL